MAHGLRVACGRDRTLRRVVGTRAALRRDEGGGVVVDGITLLALVVVVALGGYLLVALLKPEWFS